MLLGDNKAVYTPRGFACTDAALASFYSWIGTSWTYSWSENRISIKVEAKI